LLLAGGLRPLAGFACGWLLVLGPLPSVASTGVPDVASVPDGELREFASLLAGLVTGLQGQVARMRAEAADREERLAAELAAERARADALQERCEALARRLGKDSSNSSRPPSSDSPYARKPRDRSLRGRSGRRPGKQPGAESSTLRQVPDPDEDIACPPAECAACGAGLAGQPVAGERKRQVLDVPPPPPPRVTQYRLQKKACPCCGAVTEGAAPGGAAGRVQYGPRAHAIAALLTCWHHVPVLRSAQLAAALSGLAVSAGFTAAARGRAAGLLAPFMDRVRDLLAAVPVLHADETPARVAGRLRYLHVACTEYLTALHPGDRTGAGIDAGAILPRYAGVLVRDGYGGYLHLTAAVHAWCGAHLLRDLKGLHDTDPAGQAWAEEMAAVLLSALAATREARAGQKTALTSRRQQEIRSRYRDALSAGIEANWACATMSQREGMTLARRFGAREDMILRFVTDLAVPFTNNQAERDIRPVKTAQRASGTWRTLLGFADYAVVRSYLSTAAKWGIDPLDALTRLFTEGPWLPPAAAPG
jgi:transposase